MTIPPNIGGVETRPWHTSSSHGGRLWKPLADLRVNPWQSNFCWEKWLARPNLDDDTPGLNPYYKKLGWNVKRVFVRAVKKWGVVLDFEGWILPIKKTGETSKKTDPRAMFLTIISGHNEPLVKVQLLWNLWNRWFLLCNWYVSDRISQSFCQPALL